MPTREERIAKIRDECWIRYPRAEHILKRLEELLVLPQTHRMPNLLIVGDTNNGKTALVKRFLRGHQPQFGDHETASSIPVIVVQAPPIPDEGRFYQAILAQTFPSFRPSRRVDLLQLEAIRTLQSIGTKMLVIDEIHHVLAGTMPSGGTLKLTTQGHFKTYQLVRSDLCR